MITAKITGLPQLLRELQRLSEAAQGRVARNMTMVAARYARANVPVRTGGQPEPIAVRLAGMNDRAGRPPSRSAPDGPMATAA